MKFLEEYGFTKEDIAKFLGNTPKAIVDAIKEHKKLVGENIKYLKELGITNYREIFLGFYDMFLLDNSNFVEIFSKYEPEDFIEKLKKIINIVEYL